MVFKKQYIPFYPRQSLQIAFKVLSTFTLQIQLWDTAGLERAGRMTNNYYNRSHGVVFMYDVTDRTTLSRLEIWYDDAGMYTTNENTKYFVVGNKIDKDDVDVPEDLAIRMAQQRLKIPKEHVFRVSAKTGEGLEEMLVGITRILKETVKPADTKPVTMIADAEDDRRKGCC